MIRTKPLFLTIITTFILFFMLGSDLMAGGITVTPSRRTYQPNEQLSVTFNCACPFPCGDPTGMDDIYLRRQSWDRSQMGRWYGLGNLRNGGPAPTTTTRTFSIPAGAPIASDYVVTVWSGEENCSGDSSTFAIGQTRSRPPESQATPRLLPPIRVLQPGGSPSVPTGMGMTVPIVWEPSRPGWPVVDIDLIGPGGESYPIAGRVANNGRHNGWRVNYRSTGTLASPLLFGSNFKIRVRRSDDHATYGESAPFRIPRPEITISCPRVIRDGRADDRFFRGDRMDITWTSRYLDPTVRAELRTSCNRARRGGNCYGYSSGDLVAQLPATANRFNWTVGINAHPNCDPFDCRLRLILEGTDIEFTSDNSFSIIHH